MKLSRNAAMTLMKLRTKYGNHKVYVLSQKQLEKVKDEIQVELVNAGYLLRPDCNPTQYQADQSLYDESFSQIFQNMATKSDIEDKFGEKE